jgi:hypothetical protein
MQAATQRHIQSGREYDYLFPAAMNKDKTVLENASLDDTIAFIHKVVRKTLCHTAKIARTLQGPTTYATCRNIWHFVYRNVAYKKDADGLEQIRSPRRTWKDRKTGVDCDCYSTFISSILTNLRIPHQLRITKYRHDHFQHIYPIVPDGDRTIILDCVTDQFDYEVPYSEKKDIVMDLHYLDGLQGVRGDDLVFEGYDDEMGSLGANASPKKKKKKGFFKKLINKVNKLNPATVILRNGFLAAMKLNLFKVGSRIKYAYLSPEEATKRGIIPDKYQKLVKVKEKLESIFETAGGNPNNLKKAILKGKGNKNKEVSLNGISFGDTDYAVLYMDQNTPLAELLGPDIYHSENVEGMEGFEGFGGLGELGIAPAIAAASAAVAAIAKIVGSIGNIFGGKGKGSEDFAEGESAAADKEIAQTPSATPSSALSSGSSASSSGSSSDDGLLPATASSSKAATASDGENDTEVPSNPGVQAASSNPTPTLVTSDNTSTTPAPEGFWQKNKKWLVPTLIGVGGITVIAVGMKFLKSRSHAATPHLGGLPAPKRTPAKKKEKKTAVALL